MLPVTTAELINIALRMRDMLVEVSEDAEQCGSQVPAVQALVDEYDAMRERLTTHITTPPMPEPDPAASRPQLALDDIKTVIHIILNTTLKNAEKKGVGAFMSSHEILGAVIQETAEFQDEIHARGSRDNKAGELIDIACNAVWGAASIITGAAEY